MNGLSYDVAVIGTGAAGMAAALAVSKRGFTSVLLDREDYMGGILLQCIHNGFGLHHFGEELTGPEFSGRLEREVQKEKIPFKNGTTVLSIDKTEIGFALVLSSEKDGLETLECRSVILAMGSRERNRGNIRIAGDRPAGVYTAGLAQRLINIDGYIPGKKVVIIGSGDIGLIMARRMTLSGAKVEAVVEIQAFPSGLTRNIVQCLEDYDIPLYLSHATLKINGKDRVTSVEIAPLENGSIQTDKAFTIDCDTVLLSVGLVPENELSSRSDVALNPVTNGPTVDSRLMTSVPGIFAAGNVLHIHDLVDRVAAEASRAGECCADWLVSGVDSTKSGPNEISLRSGTNIRYTVPSSIDSTISNKVSLRSMVSLDKARIFLSADGKELWSKKLIWVRPGEMIEVTLPQEILRSLNSPCVLSLQAEEGGIK
ncbi:MAG TPA: FAD-dependent oxidoreductase [Treponemataceae bacterium]|nr:FAD-dependent oxidoreductase [Treponemataceae bacterium]